MKLSIPKKAQPIARFIGKNIKRPRGLPKWDSYNEQLGWRRKNLNNGRDPYYAEADSVCCPMGLIPGAYMPIPSYPGDFDEDFLSVNRIFDSCKRVESFARFWDSKVYNPDTNLDRRKEAMDLIWGKRK